VRRRTGFQSDVARWKRSQKAEDPVARQLPVQNLTIVAVDGVNLKPPLGDINSNSDNLAHVV